MIYYRCTACGHETQNTQKHCEFCGETHWEVLEDELHEAVNPITRTAKRVRMRHASRESSGN
jgi:rubredoxin